MGNKILKHQQNEVVENLIIHDHAYNNSFLIINGTKYYQNSKKATFLSIIAILRLKRSRSFDIPPRGKILRNGRGCNASIFFLRKGITSSGKCKLTLFIPKELGQGHFSEYASIWNTGKNCRCTLIRFQIIRFF